MGCGETLTKVRLGLFEVSTAPLASTGQCIWLRKTFQAWPESLLASVSLPLLSGPEPYQTPSAQPAAPALIQGMRLTASPVAIEPSLICTGGAQLRQPDLTLDTVTQICCSCGWVGFSVAQQ